MDTCHSVSQLVECLSGNSPDLHFLYMLYTRSRNPEVISVLDNSSTLLSLRSKFNLFPPPAHRNTFTELYFEYCESHLTPISYEFLGVVDFTNRCYSKDRLDTWIESLSLMTKEDRSVSFKTLTANDNILNSSKNTPSDELAMSLFKYSIEDVDVNTTLLTIAFSMTCYNGNKDTTSYMWNEALRRYPKLVDNFTYTLCVWSLAGGHKKYDPSTINRHYITCLRFVIYHGRVEILKDLISYIQSRPEGLNRQTHVETFLSNLAIQTNDIEIIKLVTDAFGVSNVGVSFLREASLDTIKFLDIDLNLGEIVFMGLYSYLSNKTSDVFNYVSSKYYHKIEDAEYLGITLEALINGHKDVYVKYFQLLNTDDGYFQEKLLGLLESGVKTKGNLLSESLFGTEDQPTVIISIDEEEIDIISEETGILYRYSTVKFNDPMRIHMISIDEGDDSVTYDTIFNSFLTDSVLENTDLNVFKRLIPWLSTIRRKDLLLYSIRMKRFYIFRIILDTFPKDTDMTDVISVFHEDNSLHRRFLQVIIRKGYSFNGDLLYPRILSSVKKMM